MLKKNINLIAIISLLVFLALATFFFVSKFDSLPANLIDNSDSSKQKDNNITNEGEDKFAPVSPEKDSPLGIALDERKVDACLNIDDEKVKNQCVILAAENIGDKDFCSSIEDKESSQICQDRVNYKQAVGNNNIELCLDIKDGVLNQSCILKIIAQEPNLKESDCDTLPEKEGKYCSDYLVSKNDYLIYQNAKNIKDCDDIVNQGIKDFCTEEFAQ